ncbi:hypothetical protein [Verminephrobacter eiseniae]|uniref:hypothetical protein n=1 Tax=Verminephrobacter eiseniae TaxID=364317 RepID=UPI002238B8B0|nr:hypothetical protein [Verminephrobacter eiseniae]MCW5236497.1 hypothetical protein [Verminephrobacter eiseniae]
MRLPTKAGNAALAIALRWRAAAALIGQGRKQGRICSANLLGKTRRTQWFSLASDGLAIAAPFFFFHSENFVSPTVWSNRKRPTRKAARPDTRPPPVSSPHDQGFYL